MSQEVTWHPASHGRARHRLLRLSGAFVLLVSFRFSPWMRRLSCPLPDPPIRKTSLVVISSSLWVSWQCLTTHKLCDGRFITTGIEVSYLRARLGLSYSLSEPNTPHTIWVQSKYSINIICVSLLCNRHLMSHSPSITLACFKGTNSFNTKSNS